MISSPARESLYLIKSGSPRRKTIFEALEIDFPVWKVIFEALEIDFPAWKVIFEALSPISPEENVCFFKLPISSEGN